MSIANKIVNDLVTKALIGSAQTHILINPTDITSGTIERTLRAAVRGRCITVSFLNFAKNLFGSNTFNRIVADEQEACRLNPAR